jgi:hypothetical protein
MKQWGGIAIRLGWIVVEGLWFGGIRARRRHWDEFYGGGYLAVRRSAVPGGCGSSG